MAHVLDRLDRAGVPLDTDLSEPGIRTLYDEAAIYQEEFIHAVEPSKAMRTALHARLADDPALRGVTVHFQPVFLDFLLLWGWLGNSDCLYSKQCRRCGAVEAPQVCPTATLGTRPCRIWRSVRL